MPPENSVLGFVDLGGESGRAAPVGMDLLHQPAMRLANIRLAGARLKPQNLIGFLRAHAARTRRRAMPLCGCQPRRPHASRDARGRDNLRGAVANPRRRGSPRRPPAARRGRAPTAFALVAAGQHLAVHLARCRGRASCRARPSARCEVWLPAPPGATQRLAAQDHEARDSRSAAPRANWRMKRSPAPSRISAMPAGHLQTAREIGRRRAQEDAEQTAPRARPRPRSRSALIA